MSQLFEKIFSHLGRLAPNPIAKTTLLLGLGFAFGTAYASSVGVLGLVRGEVFVKTPSAKTFEPAVRYAKVYNGDAIQTGKSGYAEIVLADKSLVRLAPGSSFLVRERNGEKRMSLLKGKLWASMSKALKKEKEIIFESEGVVAAIRGTIIRMERNQEGRVRIASEEGQIEVRRRGSEGRVVLDQSQEVRGSRQQLSTAQNFNTRSEDRWERFADKSYTRELQQAKKTLENLSKQIDRFDFSQAKEVERRGINKSSSLQDKEGALSILGLMLESAEKLSVQARESIWEVKNIVPTREQDPSKATYDRTYREIQALASNKINAQLEALSSFKQEVEQAVEAIEDAKKEQRSEAANQNQNPASARGSEPQKPLFEEKKQELEAHRDSLKTSKQKLDWLRQKGDAEDPKKVEDLLDEIDEVYKESEAAYNDLTSYLQANRNERSKYKKQYQDSKKTYVELVRMKQELESSSKALLASAKRRQKKEPTSALVQNPKEDKERVQGLVMRRLQEVDDATKGLLSSEASTFSREWLSVKVKLNELLNMTRAIKDKGLEQDIKNRLDEYDNLRSFARVNQRTDATAQTPSTTKQGNNQPNKTMTPEEKTLLKQLLSVHDKLNEQSKKVEAVQKEIRVLAEERLDDPKAMEAQQKRLERKLTGAQNELAKSKSVVDKYQTLKRQSTTSENRDLKVLVGQIDKLVLSVSIEKERRDLEQQRTNFERKKGQENDTTARRLLQTLTELRNQFNKHLNEIEVYKKELEINFATLEKQNRQNANVVRTKAEQVSFRSNDYRPNEVLGSAFGNKASSLLPIVNDPRAVPRDQEQLKTLDEQALGKGVEGLNRSIRELESLKREIKNATEAAEVVDYGRDSFGSLEKHFFRRVAGKSSQLERLQKEFTDFKEDHESWIKAQKSDVQQVFQGHINTLERQIRSFLAMQEPLRRQSLEAFSREASSIKSESEAFSAAPNLKSAERNNQARLNDVDRALRELREQKQTLNTVINQVNDAKEADRQPTSSGKGSSRPPTSSDQGNDRSQEGESGESGESTSEDRNNDGNSNGNSDSDSGDRSSGK